MVAVVVLEEEVVVVGCGRRGVSYGVRPSAGRAFCVASLAWPHGFTCPARRPALLLGAGGAGGASGAGGGGTGSAPPLAVPF